MANLVRPRSWGQIKPPPGAQVDWGHPLAQGLAELVVFSEGGGALVNLATAMPVRPAGANSVRVGSGAARIGTAGNTDWWTLATKSVTVSQRTWVALATLSEVKAAAYFVMGRVGNNGNSTNTTGMGLQNSAPNALVYNWADNSSQWDWASGLVPTIGKRSMYAVSVSPALAVAFLDGKYASRVDVHAAQVFDGTHKIGGDWFDPTNRHLGGDYEMVGIWNRALTRDELDWLNAEPYAFVAAPGPKVLYYDLFVVPPIALAAHGDAAAAGTADLSVVVHWKQLAGHGDAASGSTSKLIKTARFAGHGDNAAVGSGALIKTARLSGHGDNAAGSDADLLLASVLRGHGDAASGWDAVLAISATLTGHGDAASASTALLRLAAALSGHGDAAAIGESDTVLAVALEGHGDAASAGTADLAVTGTGGSTVALAGHGDAASAGTASVQAALTVSGHGDAASGSSGEVQLSASLAGHGDAAAGTGGDLDLVAALAGHGDAATDATGLLRLAVAFSGHGDASSAAVALVALTVALTGHGDAAAAGLATLFTSLPDTNPITWTIADIDHGDTIWDRGHTATLTHTGHTTTIWERAQTATIADTGHTETLSERI